MSCRAYMKTAKQLLYEESNKALEVDIVVYNNGSHQRQSVHCGCAHIVHRHPVHYWDGSTPNTRVGWVNMSVTQTGSFESIIRIPIWSILTGWDTKCIRSCLYLDHHWYHYDQSLLKVSVKLVTVSIVLMNILLIYLHKVSKGNWLMDSLTDINYEPLPDVWLP